MLSFRLRGLCLKERDTSGRRATAGALSQKILAMAPLVGSRTQPPILLWWSLSCCGACMCMSSTLRVMAGSYLSGSSLVPVSWVALAPLALSLTRPLLRGSSSPAPWSLHRTASQCTPCVSLPPSHPLCSTSQAQGRARFLVCGSSTLCHLALSPAWSPSTILCAFSDLGVKGFVAFQGPGAAGHPSVIHPFCTLPAG